jgi:hypothetical protein
MEAAIPYWERFWHCPEPLESMKFTLIYDGSLPAGKGKRALYASKIRNALHPQMRDLWDNHVLMRQLVHEARVNNRRMGDLALDVSGPTLPDYTDQPPPLRDQQIDLCAPIEVPRTGGFLPIVRKSLYLACEINILFLRHEDPGTLFEQGGDLDNRLKCFFDGLTMPNPEQATAGEEPCADPLCCLLENDCYISDFSVRTGRLLGKTEKNLHDVRIQADVTVKVLRVFKSNQSLMAG